MRKLAVVRNNTSDTCPFGLSIPQACNCVGTFIDNMKPVSDKDNTSDTNKRLLMHYLTNTAEETKKCKYADQIIENKDSVVCNYGDQAPGVHQAPLIGSPFYTRVMTDNSMEGLLTYPVNQFGDYNISKNLYYGAYSIQGQENHELLKTAKENDTEYGACILFRYNQDVLLLKRSDSVNAPGTWGLPGGHIEKGEFPEAAAMRELKEETGITIKPSDILDYDIVKKPKCVIFVFDISNETKEYISKNIKLNSEHIDFKWFNDNEIPEDLHPVAEFVLKKHANTKA